MLISSTRTELKAITFKQAFIITICLHVVAYFGVTQWSAYRKTLRAERQNKPVKTFVETKASDWPTSIEKVSITAAEQIKSAAEPIVKATEDNLTIAVNKVQEDIQNINIKLPTKQKISNLIEPKQEILTPSPTIVSKPLRPTPRLKIKSANEPKTTTTITTIPTPTLVTTFVPSTPKQTNNIPKQQFKKKPEPFPVVKQSKSIPTYHQPPIQSQKIHIIDGVEYIETTRVISSRITL